jgi:hypothetical protein
MQKLLVLALFGTLISVDCGSSSSSSSTTSQAIVTSGSNVLPLSVNLGPTSNDDNFAFASVTLCVPGQPSNCQTIDNIQIDTGSSGLRILSPYLSLPLPQEIDSSGDPLVECTQFVSSYSWGPVQIADVQIAGEHASNVPIQVIGAPWVCSGRTAEVTV